MGANERKRTAENKRQERNNRAAGKVHIRFWIDEADLAAKLDAAGVIDPNLADDPKALAEGARRLIEDMRIAVASDITR